MRVKYRPYKSDSWVDFDPGSELVCPKCGNVEPIPFGWKPHQIHICSKPDIRSWNGICNTAMFDIRSLLGDELEYVAIRCELGHLDEENIKEWYRRFVLWHIMYTCGSAPKWKPEPIPFRNRSFQC